MGKSWNYDLIVIGAGIAGMVSAVTANSLGKRVAVIEKSRIGGNCTNTTCVPSKALIRLSHLGRDMARLDRLGLREVPEGGPDGRMVMTRIGEIVRKAYEKDLPETFEKIGIDVLRAPATFIDDHHVTAGGRTLSAGRFIIATGTVPFIPPVEGIAGVDYLTNETLYRLEDLPESLLILGGGVDGLEYGSAFLRLGVKVTIVEMATRLLPAADSELVDLLLETLRDEGLRIMTGAKAATVRREDGGVTLGVVGTDGRRDEIRAARLLVAVGRKPDLEGLAPEKAGVLANARGIVTDDHLRTTARNIFACGDVTGPYQLASTAEAQGILAATNAFLPVKRKIDYRNNVYVIFTDPPLAYLGLTEDEARKKIGKKADVYRFDYGTMRRALIDGHETGLAKVVCDGRGRVAGAHILGEGAPEVIHEFQVLKALKKPLQKLQGVTHAYPTYAQALVGRASQLAFLDRMSRNFFVNAALTVLPGFSNRLHLARERLAESPAPSVPPGEAGAASEPFPSRAVEWEEETDAGMAGDCTVESRTARGTFLVLDMRGKLNASAAGIFSRAFGEAQANSRHVLLNFKNIDHMDTEGAGLLVVHAARAARKNLAVAAIGLTEAFREVFRVTGLEAMISLYDKEEDALCCPHFPSREPDSRGAAPPFQGLPLPGWTRSVGLLSLGRLPREAMNLNVHGREAVGPAAGFGCLWDKKYRLVIPGGSTAPEDIAALWRDEFPRFWPAGNRLYTSGGAPIAPGTAAVLNLRLPGGLTLATGILVIYVDDTSFCFMTVRGHMLTGWITFSSFREKESVVVQVHPLFRTADPLMEAGFRLGAAGEEDRFWHETLENLCRRLGTRGHIEQRDERVDPGRQWKNWANIRYSAAIRSSLYMPFYLFRRLLPFR